MGARTAPLEVVLAPERALDPAGDPDRARLLAGELIDVGATLLNLRFVSHSLDHYREQLDAMARFRLATCDATGSSACWAGAA